MAATDHTESPVAQLFAEFGNAELPLNSHSQALANSRVIYSGACYLTSAVILNTNAAAQYVQFHDSNVLPADGAIPEFVLEPAATSDKFVSYPLPGRFFKRGIVICNSSTAGTKTIGAADCFFDAQFIPVVS